MLGIDNFSRRILAWKVSATSDPSATAELLLGAARHLEDTKPTLLVDGRVENFNQAVDELVGSGVLNRLLARTEITFSNSLIEAWWRVLKHQWLYLNTLDTVDTIKKLVRSMSNSTIRIFRIRRFVARRPTRCTSRPAARFPVSLRSRGKQRVRCDRRSIETTPVRHASRSRRSPAESPPMRRNRASPGLFAIHPCAAE